MSLQLVGLLHADSDSEEEEDVQPLPLPRQAELGTWGLGFYPEKSGIGLVTQQPWMNLKVFRFNCRASKLIARGSKANGQPVNSLSTSCEPEARPWPWVLAVTLAVCVWCLWPGWPVEHLGQETLTRAIRLGRSKPELLELQAPERVAGSFGFWTCQQHERNATGSLTRVQDGL